MNKKRFGKLIFGRTFIIILLLILQVAIIFSYVKWLYDYLLYFYSFLTFVSLIFAIYILNKEENPAFKLTWFIIIFTFPVFGVLLYLFVKLQIGTKLIYKKHSDLIYETRGLLKQDEFVFEELKQEKDHIYQLAKYMNDYGPYPIYSNTDVKYFPLGEDKFEQLKIELENAKEFIFLEYFIVEEGIMWNTILDILKRKAKEGVDVRFMYDGTCSFMLLPYNYPKKIESFGIKCKVFSPIKPALSTYQNNRDHRKILVIDGYTAFTGGVNLADEYINQKTVYGHWKDTAIMVKGDAVKSFTIMFLQMWGITEHTEENYKKYIKNDLHLETTGYVMPYGDSPLDNELVGENVYLDILNNSTKYVHIMTPYLILDNETLSALKYSAKCGIETIIIMPHIPDKIYAYLLARSYYTELISSGVKIYEYTPGFIHAKVFVSDDIKAVVGTINLDYRSLYLHFECATFMYKVNEIKNIEKDFQETLKKCQLITLEESKKYPLFKRILGKLLRVIAPLM